MSKPEMGFTIDSAAAHVAIVLPPIPAPSPLHFIECASHVQGQSYWTERAGKETHRDQVISDIASGQLDALTVIRVDLASGRSWDVSLEIAREVAIQCNDHGSAPKEAMAFMERHLSAMAIALVWRQHGLM